ncbi:MAG: DoxX family protein [Thermoplasmata archaeon]|nr:DoxX family protein [Thermoplasmata archaeon]
MNKAAFPSTVEWVPETKFGTSSSVKVLSAARILFGSIFLFDGLLKWMLFAQGQMQGVVQGFGVDFLSNNWVAVGMIVGIGETLAGAALIAGLFQRPAAIGAAAIMVSIWAYTGYGGWGQAGYTDPGGDLMLALIFAVLVFVPTAYGIAARLKLRERFGTSSLSHRLLRFLVA